MSKHIKLLSQQAPFFEIDIGQSNQNKINRKTCKLFAMINILVTLTTGVFVLAEFTDSQFQRQALIFSLTIGPALLTVYYEHAIHLKKIQCCCFLVVLGMTGVLMILRFPYYSIISIAAFLVDMFILYYRGKLEKNRENIGFSIITIYAFIAMLVDEKILNWEWKYVSIPCFIAVIVIVVLFLAYLFCVNDLIKQEKVVQFLWNFGWFSVLIVILYMFVPRDIFACLITIVFTLNILSSVIQLIFLDRIFLIMYYTSKAQKLTLFKTHTRQFSDKRREDYNMQLLDRQPVQCLLCENIAYILNNDCGHLTLCMQCNWSFFRKDMRKCIICHEYIKYQTELNYYKQNIFIKYQNR